MSTSLVPVVARLTADTAQFSRGMGDATRSFDRFLTRHRAVTQTMREAGRALSRNVTIPLGTAGLAATKMAMDVEASFAKVEGLVGVAGAEVQGMRDSMSGMAGETGQSMAALADGLFFVTSAGIRGGEAMDVLEMSAKAASSGLGETAVVADLVTSAMNAYGSDVIDASTATDVLVGAVREGKAEASELASSMGSVLPIASELGITFDQVGAAQAAMTRTGTDASNAATQLRAIMVSFLNPAEQSREAMAEFGLSAEGLREQLREEGLISTLLTLKDAVGDNEEAMAKIFPNVRALAGVLDLVGANADENVDIFDRMTNTVGLTDKAFSAASDTVQFKWRAAIEAGKELLIEFGDAAAPAIKVFLDGIRTVIGWLGNLPGPIKAAIALFAGMAAALGPVLVVSASLLKLWGSLKIIGYLRAALNQGFLPVAKIAERMGPSFSTAAGHISNFGVMAKNQVASMTVFGRAVQAVKGFGKGLLSAFINPATIAIAAIAGAAYYAKKRFDEWKESTRSISDLTGDLAQSLGITIDEFARLEGAQGEAITTGRRFAQENETLLRQFREMDAMAAEQRAIQLGFEFQARGATPEEATEAVQDVLRFSGHHEIAVGLDLDSFGNMDVADALIGRMETIIARSDEANGSMQAWTGTQATLRTEVDDVAQSFTTLLDVVLQTGDIDSARVAWRGMSDAINETETVTTGYGTTVERTSQEMRTFVRALGESVGITGSANRRLFTMTDLTDELRARGFVPLAQILDEVNTGQTKFNELGTEGALRAMGLLDASAALGDELGDLEDDIDDVTESTRSMTEAMRDHHDELRAQIDPIFRVHKALRDMEKAQQDVTQAGEDYGEGSAEVREALFNEVAAAQEVRAAFSELKAAMDDGTTSRQDVERQLRDLAIATGLSEDAVLELLESMDEFNDTADNMKPVGLEVDEAMRQQSLARIAEINSRADHATRNRSITITANAAQAHRTMANLSAGSGSFLNHDGGWAGTGPMHHGPLKADEVRAVLQRGEYVMSRREVAQGYPEFHDGGPVGALRDTPSSRKFDLTVNMYGTRSDALTPDRMLHEMRKLAFMNAPFQEAL